MVKMRRLPEDDYMHEPESASNFNESRYYNWFDHKAGMGGWVRMGNRVNEGYAELTVCLYLPDGRVGFMFKRPKIDSNKEHHAGGLRFEVLEPYEEHRLTYSGKVCVLTNPRDMADPREAFTNNPHLECTIDLHLTNVGPAQGGEPEWEEGEQKPDLDPEKMFARGHTEQHMRSVGTVTVGDDTFEITDGLGLRDHSWGPRYWQNVWWYRWLTVNLGPDLGFAVTISGDQAGDRRVHGFLYDKARYGDDRWVHIRRADLSSDYDGEWFPATNRITVGTDDHTYEVHGDVWSNIPLRNRREDMVTRITEGMTRWSYEDLEGAGLSEYLDQIIDGTPVGTNSGN
ncbi:MAG TPA: hypothetical protein VG435_21115 [Acidimicrobiales bacterium]|jgi:hypothetical protein|nr:hypothetical protein [Acidimicrobiales bacterium]